jgi:UDP-glucuronate decarboxylase
MKKILVTGGAGFIGSHLCKKLLENNNIVYCLDNFYSSDRANIKDMYGDNNFKFIEQDIVSTLNLKVDEIYNLACPASPVAYQMEPVKTIETCFIGATNVLKLASKLNIRVLQASTSEVYGDPLVHPQNENYNGNVNPVGIRSCYDEGKRAAETLFFDYNRQFNVDIKVVRIFNTFGPKMQIDDGRVVSNFICQALNGEDISIYGDGNQTRSFCFVEDMVEGLISMMESEKFKGPVNLGNPQEITVKKLAQEIIEMTSSSSKIIHLKLPEDDPLKRKPDISLAQKHLGWSPKISRLEGLKKTISYFKLKLSL